MLASNDIVDIIGAYLDLKPSGAGRYKALCPFHSEKTPSFTVSQDRQMFHCFGCGSGGDALGFLMKHENLPFGEALRRLADRGGVRLPAATAAENREEGQRQQLLDLNRFAASFFREQLEDALRGGPGRRYLHGRALRPETERTFGIGYAGEMRTAFLDAARKAGHSQEITEIAGFTRRGDRGSNYDFFRDRLMFPIRDVAGNVVAFGGRDLSGKSPAKYINTPESPIYKKGRTLYGLYQARDAMRQSKLAILVEGYFDLLRCVDAGVTNVVASCGTALTSEQAALIHRYVPEVVVVYDGDAAGIRAALRGVGVLTAAGLVVRALTLPDGMDPDDFILAQGGEAFRERVAEAFDFVTFYARANETRLTSIEGRTEVARELFEILLGVTDELRREQYLKRIARELGLSEWALRSEFMKRVLDRDRSAAAGATMTERTSAIRYSADDVQFAAALMAHPELLEQSRETLRGVDLEPGSLTEVLGELFGGIGPDSAQHLESEEARQLLSAAAATAADFTPQTVRLVEKRLTALRKEALRREALRIQDEMREAERAQDTARRNALLMEQMRVRREMERAGAQ